MAHAQDNHLHGSLRLPPVQRRRKAGNVLLEALAVIVYGALFLFGFVFVPVVFSVSICLTHPELPIAEPETKIALAAFMALIYLPLLSHSLSLRDGLTAHLWPMIKVGTVFGSTLLVLSLIY